MKNISIALNGVLIIAVAVLYYLHFSNPNTVNVATNDNTIEEELPIDAETVMNNTRKASILVGIGFIKVGFRKAVNVRGCT